MDVLTHRSTVDLSLQQIFQRENKIEGATPRDPRPGKDPYL